MDTKKERVKSKASPKSIPEKEQRGKGRPKLPEGEKGTYEAVLLPKSIIAKVELLNEKNRSISTVLLHTYVDSFDEYETVREYYWKLTFSYSIYKFLHNLPKAGEKAGQIESEKANPGKLRAVDIANSLKINTFNLKPLTSGKGQTASFVKLIDSLYRGGINVLEIKYMPGIVLMAYAKYIQSASSE